MTLKAFLGMPEPLRSAEKNRVSSCKLADEIASAVITKFRQLMPETPHQIVLAGIAAVISGESVQVVTIGLGNKFQPRGVKSDTNLRDCHAEILARRAFKLWLLRQYEVLLNGGTSRFFYISSERKLVVDPDVSFSLYVSSCPCGNACIRRWGDSPKERSETQLGAYTFPLHNRHAVFHAHARHEGQLAVSYKGESSILSCSDKILGWNVKGLQGTGLSGIVATPIYLKAIVIGRKFVRKHSERAFCCRLTAKGVHKDLVRVVNHPIMMCTAVKLDESVFNTSRNDERDAAFSDEAMWWIYGSDSPHVLNGDSGSLRDGTYSELSRASLSKIGIKLRIIPPLADQLRISNMLDYELNKL